MAGKSKGKRRRGSGNRRRGKKDLIPDLPKKVDVIFYGTREEAKADLDRLREKATQLDQLNIVLRAEDPMDDPELLAVGKLYAGEAWALIHERRLEEGWYESHKPAPKDATAQMPDGTSSQESP